jgi:transcriptional regulator with XRE-family HTH domain
MATSNLVFGTWLGEQMSRRELRQVDLAQQLGVSQQTISHWTTGHSPRVEAVRSIARAFGISSDDVLEMIEQDARALASVRSLVSRQ